MTIHPISLEGLRLQCPGGSKKQKPSAVSPSDQLTIRYSKTGEPSTLKYSLKEDRLSYNSRIRGDFQIQRREWRSVFEKKEYP